MIAKRRRNKLSASLGRRSRTRCGPLGIVVVHPWHDLANLACLARGIIGGAQRMVEYDDACGPAAATAQAIYGTVAIGAMTALLSETRSEPS
jgi:hypothetical protein